MASSPSRNNVSPPNMTSQKSSPISNSKLSATAQTFMPAKTKWCSLCRDNCWCPVCNTEEDDEPATAVPETLGTTKTKAAEFHTAPGHEREAFLKAMVMQAEEYTKQNEAMKGPQSAEVPHGNWLAVKKRVDAWLVDVDGCKGER